MYEQELKLTAPDQETLHAVPMWEGVQDLLVKPATGPLRFLARYHDTPHNALENYMCALRSRLEGDRYVAALKMPGQIVGGISSREEFECAVSGWIEETNDIPAGEFREKGLVITGGESRLLTTVQVDMMRTIYDLKLNGTRIELVTDSGTVSAGNRHVDLLEVELELKEGALEDIVSLGSLIRSRFDLIPSTKTKYEIGMELWKAA